MLNNLYNLFFFPEATLLLGSLAIILIALFLKKNTFSITSNLSTILLIVVGIIVYIDKETTFLNFNKFFIESDFIKFFQLLVILGSISTILISKNYYKDQKLIFFEIPILILFSTFGMLLLIASNNLMAMYLGIELQSLTLYVIAAIKRDSLKSSESGLKYFILGALSSGILLYGCSLIYGFTGHTDFNSIYSVINSLEKIEIGLIFGLIFILVGLAFKVSAVPFHMWTPDVYEGAPTSITAFFAIVSKLSAVAIIYRFCLEPFSNLHNEWIQIIIFLSIASMFLGSIAAIRQSNIKRLLAYSSIGHVGYVLIGLVSFNQAGVKGAAIYMLVYLFMNIAIFSILLSLKFESKYIDKIEDLSGLSKSKPILSLFIAIIMLSMAGIPPFAGFFGKFYIFMAALNAKIYYLAILGVISSVIAAFYYLKIVKIIYFDSPKSLNYENNDTNTSKLILLISILFISLFIIYPSLFTSIGIEASKDFIFR